MRSWDPGVAGIAGVLHARFVAHAYPPHTHDTWTLLLVDAGGVHYDLDRRAHDTGSLVTLLSPHVPHDGRSRTPEGLRKRVLYLDADVLPPLAGRAVDDPALPDPMVARTVAGLHDALLRELLDAHVVEGVSLARAATELHVSTAHLARTFTHEIGMSPHAYLVGRRIDKARRLLLTGHGPADVAALAGFQDQAHLNRHFRRVLGTTPGRFARR